MTRTCVLCGRTLPKMPWWKRLLSVPLNDCGSYGADKDACWKGLNERLGIDFPGPRPT